MLKVLSIYYSEAPGVHMHVSFDSTTIESVSKLYELTPLRGARGVNYVGVAYR